MRSHIATGKRWNRRSPRWRAEEGRISRPWSGIHDNPNAMVLSVKLDSRAGYKVPPHFHPADENITVLSGIFSMGMGDTWEDAKMRALPAGSFSTISSGMHHFAGTRTGAVIQVHAMGPWSITYVNPKDDPRNA